MDPARLFKESLTSRPELENSQGQSLPFVLVQSVSASPPKADNQILDQTHHAGLRVRILVDVLLRGP